MIPDFNRILISVDKMVIKEIIIKYGLSEKKALYDFFHSETYKMLTDIETGVYRDSHLIVFDMWEAEKVTGDPRNSQYIRGL